VIVALEQNMLEAEIICLDMEKIMAVILSIIVQVSEGSECLHNLVFRIANI